jgi:hypothetical protein
MTSFSIPNYGAMTPVNYQLAAPGGNGLGLQMPGTTPTSPLSALGSGGDLSADSFNFGANIPTLRMGLSGLNTLGNLWGAWQAQGLARDQLNFTRNVTNTNLNNSIQSYNTALADRARARGVAEGQSSDEVSNYIASNRLTR